MKVLIGTVFLTGVLASSAIAQSTVRYGEDGRRNRSQISDEKMREISRATVLLMDKRDLKAGATDGALSLKGETLAQYGYCSDQPFANEVSAGWCSGFLVGPNTVVTAGHCIENVNDCDKTAFVFDYTDKSYSGTTANFDKSKVYSCSKIISRKMVGDIDYAVIELDREVTDRSPMKLRKEGKVKRGTKLAVLGHPEGIPLKITIGGKVKRNKNADIFRANLDTFGGNSGSAVINSTTGEVEGILVAGVQDNRYNLFQGCMVVNKCYNSFILNEVFKRKKCTAPTSEKDAVSGEQVVRIKHVLPHIK